MKNENIMVAVSGGRTSGMMALEMYNSVKYKDCNMVFVFANTGLERIETIEFLKEINKRLDNKLVLIEGKYSPVYGNGASYTVKNFDNLNMRGTPLFNSILKKNAYSKQGVFSYANPYCSDMTKTRPMNAFARDYFEGKKFIKAIGYRKEDMPRRITYAEIKEVSNKVIFPMLTDYDFPISVIDVENFYKKAGFSLKLNSRFGNCKLCVKRSNENNAEILSIDKSAGNFFIGKEKLFKDQFFREQKTIKDLIIMSENLQVETLFGRKNEMFIYDDSGGCTCGNIYNED